MAAAPQIVLPVPLISSSSKKRKVEEVALFHDNIQVIPISPSFPTNGAYVCEGQIDEGAFAKVFKAHVKKDPTKIVALKKQSSNGGTHLELYGSATATIVREVRALVALHGHPNIVSFIEAFTEGWNTYIVMEYVPHNLESMIREHRRQGTLFSRAVIKSLLQQLLDAVAFAHDKQFMHRDIKPLNILVDDSNRLYLADWGMSRAFSTGRVPMTTVVVTIWYRAPELLLGNTSYTAAIDIWSIGCIMYELFTGTPLFATKSHTEIDQVMAILEKLGTPSKADLPKIRNHKYREIKFPEYARNLVYPDTMTGEARDLLDRMLCYDPANRITAADALKHAYFSC